MFKRQLYSGQSFGHPRPIRTWLYTHRKVVIPGAIAAFFLVGAGGAFAYNHFTKKPSTTPTPPAKVTAKAPTPAAPPKYFSPLSGVEVSKDQSERPITGVMIENSPDARPQSGLIDAGVVFEAIAEGGITRFLTFFEEGQPQTLGPVRSLRIYYVNWLGAFDAPIAHVGGSAKALETVRGAGFKDIDQFFNGGAYWRASDRYAPHNVYTSFAKLDELNKAKGYYKAPKDTKFQAFQRKSDAPSTTPNAAKIQVSISSALYNSSYTYDKGTNSYLRSQAGEGHIDRESKQQLHPKVVVVMKIPQVVVLEDGYRESIQVIGQGDGWVFQDGTVKHVQWRKDSPTAQITFKDDDNQLLKFNAGQTWLTAIPTTQTVGWQP